MEDDKDAAQYSSKWWLAEIELSDKWMEKQFRVDGREAVRRYLDYRGNAGASTMDDSSARKYNIFWSNVQVVKSALYATPPRPEIKRQHDDAKDDIARCAALILERIINFGLDKDLSDMHKSFDKAVDDLLIPGLGQVWCRYEVDTEKFMAPSEIPGKAPMEAERITREAAPTDYVSWEDFLFSVARTWEEVWWVGRRIWMRKSAFVRRFGSDKWNAVQTAAKTADRKGETTPKGFVKGRAEVYEIYCQESNKVYWVSSGLDECLDEKEDPLKLDGFWPCPEPVLATHTTNEFLPRSDYTMVKDQYHELDILNDRISTITKALRVVGMYDKNSAELNNLLSGPEFAMIPVEDWESWAEKEGMRGATDWFPVEVLAEVLDKLNLQRQAVIQQIYELTSISDIQRGASNPRETLGAQKLKAQFSSVRLQLKQQDVGKFVRSVIRIKCEIVRKHWQPETIKKVSAIEYTESASFADAAIALLKSDDIAFRVEVGEETLSLADYNAEREMRTELLTTMGQFLSQAGQMAMEYPAMLPYMIKMISWVLSSFRGSSDIESVIDEAAQGFTNNPPQPTSKQQEKPEPPPPDPLMEAQIKQAQEAQQQASDERKTQMVEANKFEIAKMNTDTQKVVANASNETKLIIAEMANHIKKMGEENKVMIEEFRGHLEAQGQRDQQAHDARMQRESAEGDAAKSGHEEMKGLMTKLTENLTKPRKRTPVRDKNGDILYVEDKLGD